MKIKDLAPNIRPRERLLKHGSSVLSDAELLAIILQTGTQSKNVLDVSSQILSDYGFEKLSDLSVNELKKLPGVGIVKALQLKALFEINKRISSVSSNNIVLNKSSDVFNYMHDAIKGLKQEHFFVLSLDSKNKIISEKVIAIGTLNAALIHPREIFKEAIRNSANSIILVHNHPSGDPTPSKEDLKVTEELVNASRFLDISVLDHVIIGRGGHWSWKDNG